MNFFIFSPPYIHLGMVILCNICLPHGLCFPLRLPDASKRSEAVVFPEKQAGIGHMPDS